MTYPRNIFPELSRLLKQFPVVAIIGARQVGKTTLAKQVAPDFKYVDMEKGSDFDNLTRDIDFFFKQHPQHIIFDEAQLYPQLFSHLRGVIDADRQHNGRFIITGSSSPELVTHISESLAGRIAIIELGTLKANELDETPISDFYDLMHEPHKASDFIINQSPLSDEAINRAWFKGGYPQPCSVKDEKFYREWMENYYQTYINRDIAELFPKLDKIAFRRFILMLSDLSGSILNKADLARAVQVSEPTISDYLDIASGTFIWRQLPCFEGNPGKRLMKRPKGHIRDTGLMHYLQQLASLAQLQNSVMVGRSFESFVIEEILKGLSDKRIAHHAYYYRTHAGAEIDLVLKGLFGTIPIEIKHGIKIDLRQLRGLQEFIQEYNCPYGIVVNRSDKIEWLTPDIVQLPVGYV